MVLRFLFLILFLIFACADFERDNVYDTERSNPTYDLCGSQTQRFSLETQFCSGNRVYDLCSGSEWEPSTQRCESNVVETVCGGSWYDTTNVSLRCESNIVKTVCGSSLYDATNASLRCENDVVETACGSGWYDAANANLRCESNVIETKCGNSWYNAANVSFRCRSNVVETECGGGWVSAETHFCYNGKVEDRCGERPENFNTNLYECRDTNKIYLKDSVSHGGKNYGAVLMGTHTWLAENLNYEVEGSNCYEDLDSNCVIHGRLYNWAAAMNTAICPRGWHLPSYDELSALSKSEKIEAYGFADKASGFGFPGGSFFDGIDEYGGWWSASVTQDDTSSVNSLYYDGSKVYLGISNKNMFLSVRCVKD